jgi:hypothetical protein
LWDFQFRFHFVLQKKYLRFRGVPFNKRLDQDKLKGFVGITVLCSPAWDNVRLDREIKGFWWRQFALFSSAWDYVEAEYKSALVMVILSGPPECCVLTLLFLYF